MNKGFLYSGTVFFLAIALIISSNYIFLSRHAIQNSAAKILAIDKVYNRAIDAIRIADDAINDQANCKAAENNKKIEAAFSDPLINSSGALVTFIDLYCVDAATKIGTVYFTVASEDGTVFKYVSTTVRTP